ncbi:hypothetical protein HK105_207418 [Polyrhizophydium stewartii]|uniref:Uncharacterized protein n=1 Tax=Polyrhizophydium stewartii TaxID=2732419 RepID=A0ABR4N0L7_9FUNG
MLRSLVPPPPPPPASTDSSSDAEPPSEGFEIGVASLPQLPRKADRIETYEADIVAHIAVPVSPRANSRSPFVGGTHMRAGHLHSHHHHHSGSAASASILGMSFSAASAASAATAAANATTVSSLSAVVPNLSVASHMDRLPRSSSVTSHGLAITETDSPATPGGLKATFDGSDEHLSVLTTVSSEAPEVALVCKTLSSQGRLMRLFSRKRLDPVLSTFSPLRQMYRLHRKTVRAQIRSGSIIESIAFGNMELVENWRKAAMLHQVILQTVIALVDVIADLLLCAIYIYEREKNLGARPPEVASLQPSWAFVARPLWAFYLAISLSSFTLLTRALKLLISRNVRKTLLSFSCLIDLAVALPFLACLHLPYGNYTYIPYFFRSLVLVAQLDHVLRLRRKTVSNYVEKIILLGVTMVIIIYVGMCSFEFFENNFATQRTTKLLETNQLTMIQVLYYIIITISTVGYGDITPNTVAGQVVVIVMILVSIVVLPGLVSDVQEKLKLQKSGGGSYTLSSQPFVVVCGVFYGPHKAYSNIVILSRNKPPNSIRILVSNSINKTRVTFLRGSGLDAWLMRVMAQGETDLDRVQLRSARAAFILADSGAPDPEIEDEHNTLRALAFDDYAPNTPLYVDNLLPATEAAQEKTTTAAVCLHDLVDAFLAFNCVYRGIATLVVNLLHHQDEYSDYGDPWRALYADGMSNFFDAVPLNPLFVGLSFSKVALYVYKEFQIALVGIQTGFDLVPNGQVVLNPGPKYLLQESDICLCITPSQEDINAMLSLPLQHLQRTFEDFEMPRKSAIAQKPSIARFAKGKDSQTVEHPYEAHLRKFVKGYPTRPWTEAKVPQCYLLPRRAQLHDILLNDASQISQHIIVCTLSYSIFRFLCTLRSTSITAFEYKVIVILCPTRPTEREIHTLGLFPDVYVVLGDPLSRVALESANIRDADKVVITKLRRGQAAFANEPDGSQDQFSDGSAILVAHLIYDMFHREGIRKYFVLELGRKANIKFLRPTGRKRPSKRVRSRFTEPTDAQAKRPWEESPFMAPVFAGGRVVAPSMLEPLLFQAYRTPCAIQFFHALCGVRFKSDLDNEEKLGLRPGHVCYIAPPEGSVGKTYGALVHSLIVNTGFVPIGLLRQRIDPSIGNRLPFVVSNPVASLIVKPEDLVYVLAIPSG